MPARSAHGNRANLRWFGSRMFLMRPVQDLVAKQLSSLEKFPPARGSSLSLGKLMDRITYGGECLSGARDGRRNPGAPLSLGTLVASIFEFGGS